MQEIADILICSDDLYGLVALKNQSNALVGRIHRNYTSTLAISLKSMQDYYNSSANSCA